MCIKPFFKLKIFNRRANKSGIGADQCVHSGFLITKHQKPVRWQSYIHLPTSRRGLEAEDTSNNAVVRVAGHVHDGQTVHEYIFQRDIRSINKKKKKKKTKQFHSSSSFLLFHSSRQVLRGIEILGRVARARFLDRNAWIIRCLLETARVYRTLSRKIVDPGTGICS